MRPLLLIAVVSASYCSSPAFAQSRMGATTPPLSATSPLGTDPGTPVAGTGIPMGAAVPSSAIVSSLPSYPTGASSTACSTLGTPSTQMYGSPSSYDGGGVTLSGAATPATASTVATATPGTQAASGMTAGISATSGLSMTSGMAATAGLSGMCGSGSSSITASSTPTSTSSATTSTRAGIPLDSTEIGNLGVSSAAAVPMPNLSATIGTVGPSVSVPTVPTVSSPSTAYSATTSNVP
jgi:hypothetical protein